jgi:Transposase DDE domain group 1
VQATNTRARFEVTGDGEGIVGHAGAVVLAELSDRLGLTRELGRRANLGLRVGAHDRGQVLRDLAVMLAAGGDCVSDLRLLRDQPEVFGEVASVPTAWRVLAWELPADPRGIAAVWSALARARARAWALGAAPRGPLRIDLDATLIQAHSDKQGAAPTFKKGFGFHPLLAFLDRGDGTGEALAGVLREGNAASNTAEDHLAVLGMALAALPKLAPDSQPILVRCDSAGATHALVEEIVRRRLHFSVGFDLTEPVCRAILALPESTWQPALDPDTVVLEARHRPHARVEDRIRCGKASGLQSLPFFDFAANDAWLALAGVAATLVCWAQALLLDDPHLKVAEPKTLRYRLWHVPGRIVRHARRQILRLPRAWPWTPELVAAFGRVRALPAPE